MICIVSPTENEHTVRGKRHVDLTTSLIEDGHKVSYVTSNFDHANKTFLETNKPHVFNYVFINAGRYSRNVSAQRVFWNLKFSLKAFYLLAIKVKSGDIVLCASRPN